ncbi:MAG TPA: response regulator [Planktothrix sp.]|jgi:CheY-like chemotaxis protein
MILQKVLIVDDDASIRKIAEISLSSIGKLEVITASSGAEALEKVQQFKPDLILLDVHMPDMGGVEVLEALKASPNTVHIPVVLMTASYNEEQTRLYGEKGAGMVIMKPFQAMELPNQLKSFMAEQ